MFKPSITRNKLAFYCKRYNLSYNKIDNDSFPLDYKIYKRENAVVSEISYEQILFGNGNRILD
ncbi:hypothetical protein L3N51_00446 [Metallosphaera sp. J1]|nr:hypothetical protein [Metallosphaera javensis (ex Hofmann et al. 2022)]BCS93982.1 MAG: hypothetical protein MjAS7_2590 [Metallosphaera javensis (ex Sakai et al. 2022)]